MASSGQRTAVVAPMPDVAGGRAWHGRRANDLPPSEGEDGVTVLIDGEVFEEEGPAPDPAAVIAGLYRGRAEDRIADLNGSFAAIVVDAPRDRVLLATDRLGSRPLFVWTDGGRFSVASRLDPLLADERIPRILSRDGLCQLLSYARTYAEATQYRDVWTVPGSEIVVLDGGRVSRRQTRRLRWRRPDFSLAEGAERLAVALRRSVMRRMPPGERQALLLSGGLDARLVLAATAAEGRDIACVTQGPFENREVRIARRSAAVAGMRFRFLEQSPLSLPQNLVGAVRLSDGLYNPPLNLFATFEDLARDADVVFSGHGIDYMLRGMYLPKIRVQGRRSATTLPRLIRLTGTGPATVADNQLVAVKASSWSRALRPELLPLRRESCERGIARTLSRADIEHPYDAWDALILVAQARHYAYGDFIAMSNFVDHRVVPFDTDVLDLSLSMPPEWRIEGRLVRKAGMRLNPRLMKLPNANTGLPAHWPVFLQGAIVIGRAGLRRLGLLPTPAVPDPTMTQGSWSNNRELLRRSQVLRDRLETLPRNPAVMETGLFSAEGLSDVVDEHMSGRSAHTKFLMAMLTLSAWLETHPYAAAD